jgi:DNA-binding NtrC family response regulator
MERLVEYDWPGNVRELSNAVERAIVIHRGETLSFEDIVGIKPVKDVPGSYCGQEAADLSMKNIEVQHIMRAMEMAGGNVEGPQGAAAILRLNPGTLRSRMRKLGIPFGRKAKALYARTQ